MSKSDSHGPSSNEADVPVDRRGLIRYVCCLHATCDWIVGSTELSHPAIIQEISAHGMTVVLAERLESGAVLTIKLPTATERVAFTKLAQVIHARPDNASGWSCGVYFLQPLRPEEVEWLLYPEGQQMSRLYFDI